MSDSKSFDHISRRVLKALDKNFPGWKDLVPDDQVSSIDEESLIQLLKDRKRAEIYRIVTDKRNAFLKEAYEGSDRSFYDLTQEFATFSADQTKRWMAMEEKMSSILLEHKAHKETVDIDEMKVGLDTTVNMIFKKVDKSVIECNSYMTNYLGSFFNADVNGVSRVGSSELKSFWDLRLNNSRLKLVILEINKRTSWMIPWRSWFRENWTRSNGESWTKEL